MDRTGVPWRKRAALVRKHQKYLKNLWAQRINAYYAGAENVNYYADALNWDTSEDDRYENWRPNLARGIGDMSYSQMRKFDSVNSTKQSMAMQEMEQEQ